MAERDEVHVHDWKVLKSEEVSNPSSGPSAFGWQTVALLRCGTCGDVDSRILAGRWNETFKAAGPGIGTAREATEENDG